MTIFRRHPRGFTLVELLVILMLLSVFLVILSQLFIVTNRAGSDAQKQLAGVNRADTLLDQMRRDVWDAHFITADGPQLQLAEARTTVFWISHPEGTLTRRTIDTPPQKWTKLPAFSFTAKGPVVTVHLQDNTHQETITFISQPLVSEAAP